MYSSLAALPHPFTKYLGGKLSFTKSLAKLLTTFSFPDEIAPILALLLFPSYTTWSQKKLLAKNYAYFFKNLQIISTTSKFLFIKYLGSIFSDCKKTRKFFILLRFPPVPFTWSQKMLMDKHL